MILDDQATIDRYTREGWWGQTTVHDLFLACVRARPEQPALIDAPNRAGFGCGPPRTFTWRELDAAVDLMAARLYARGVRERSIVVVQLPNIAEIVIAFLACARLGAIASPVMVAYGERDLRRIVRDLRPACVIAASRFKQLRPGEVLAPICAEAGAALLVLGDTPDEADPLAAAALRPMRDYVAGLRIDANETVTLHWTSGTTGEPKCVPRSHNQWHGTGTCCTDVARLQPADRVLAPMQMVHTAGYSGVLMPCLEVQGTIVLHQPFDMAVYLSQIETLRIHSTVAAPAMLNAILRDDVFDGHDVSSLRTIMCGSAPLDPWMIEGFRDRYGIEIVNAFGSTEGLTLFSTAAISQEPYRRARYFPRFNGTPGKKVTGASWGVRIAAGVEGKLVDIETREEITTAGKPGEFVFRSPALFAGYWSAEGALDRGDFDEHGYFHTGELFEIAGDGEASDYYHYIDRLKDVINRGGVKIPAGELESILQSLPGVREAAVVGFPDVRLGERICAVVALEPGAQLTLEACNAQLAERGVARFMLPERLEVLETLPRNLSGKVLKGECVKAVTARGG